MLSVSSRSRVCALPLRIYTATTVIHANSVTMTLGLGFLRFVLSVLGIGYVKCCSLVLQLLYCLCIIATSVKTTLDRRPNNPYK